MNAETLFTNAFNRMVTGWAIIDSFRYVGRMGLPHARKVLQEQNAAYVARMALAGDLDRLIIGIKNEEDRQKTAGWLHHQLTDQAMNNTEASMDCASIVFAHSLLDELISDFIEVTMQADPEYWWEQVREKPVTLASVRADGYEKLFAQALEAKRQWIRRNASLRHKAEVLLAVCKPQSGKFNAGEYVFDIGKLEAIDTLRKEIVHGEKFGQKLTDTESNLEYLRNTGSYFLSIVNERFDVRVNPVQMFAGGKT